MHGNLMTDETIEHLAASGTPLVPTLLLLANVADWPPGRRAAADARRHEADAGPSGDALHRAHEAGREDCDGHRQRVLGHPLRRMARPRARTADELRRADPLEAIQAGTSHGALMLGLDGQIGVVAEGMIADLIIVDGDPVADITVLQRRECIQTVIQNGDVVEFDEGKIARSWPMNGASGTPSAT